MENNQASEPEYVLEVLRQGSELTLYRGRRSAEPPVLALAVSALRPSTHNLERLAHEYALAAELDSAWAVRPLALTRIDGRPMLLLEDPGGESLERVRGPLAEKPLDVLHFLQLAVELARALRQMHQRRLIHKDIKPSNVLVDGAGHVRLMGFGFTSRLRRERQAPTPPDVIAGSFAYMAPEQTGRMNRSVDARSDLYSLGVTLYELMTGTLPFAAADPMEWIHCHIARQPPEPSDRAPGLPRFLGDIVLKLLAKTPEDRYQTAAGLEIDLRACLTAWESDGRIARFTLGERDVPDRLVLSEKLYGREAEIDVLLRAFERVVSQGDTELVLVSGPAGIGKSSIVNELHKVLVSPRGTFAAGKFDQYKRDIPYATLAQAFRELVRQLLSKNEAELSLVRAELGAALGANGQLMVDLIPELALVIGKQPPIPRVEPQEVAPRFYLVFRSLLRVFARQEHPLVLFIDDLQWLDSATLDLLQRLVTDPEARHLLVVGAYRDNEVGPMHPLAATLDAIRGTRATVSTVTLAPLGARDIAQLAAEALHVDAAHAEPLAELVSDKAGGNPFFAIQFISELAEEELIEFDGERARWHWDIDRIRAKGITDNVADLMATKLSRLSEVARDVLGQGACLGNTADIATLALLRETTEDQVRVGLEDAAEAGLIMPASSSFTFIHDRVHEAAYALIPQAKRAAAHLRIGRALLSRTPQTDLDENIFEIVNHFERGAAATDTPAERDQVAALNLRAGRRAKTSSAYASAQAYFTTGRALLGEDCWATHYRLTFDLELQQAECEIVGGQLAGAEARLTSLSQRAAELDDHSDVVCLTVLLCFTTGRNERAVEVALAFLARVGIVWSARPSEVEVRREYEKMRRFLASRPVDALVDLPAMSDPACIATMAVLTELFPAAYAVDRYLLELVLLRMTNLSLEHGNCESSSVAYSALNMALGAHFADYATACSLGQLACELVDRGGMERYKARVYSCFAAFSMPWIKHLPLCQPLMTHAFRVGRSMGDTAFAAYNSRNLITHLLVSGTPLAEVQREAEQALDFAKGLELGLPAERFIAQLELIRKLRRAPMTEGAAKRPQEEVTTREPADAEWFTEDGELAPGLAMMVCYHWVFRLQERYFAGDFVGALHAASRVEDIRWAMRSSIEEAEYDFYASLSCAASIDGASDEQRHLLSIALSRHYERIVVCAENCPENFANRKALVGAEMARLDGRELEAQRLYEQAARLARKHGFLQNEALANELAGQFHAARGLDTIAEAYLFNARDCYERWGAHGKVQQLALRYQLHSHIRRDSFNTTANKPVGQLDVETVDKASQTLSRQTDLPSLLEKLMNLAIVHAGAERGLLILLHDDEPHIEAAATTKLGSLDVVVRTRSVGVSDLPLSALQYVLRTHQRLVLDDATAEGLDPDDEYVARNRPRSMLCLPIFEDAKVIGALYLENNLSTGVFTSDRVAVLDFLASQAAIALENARLYSELQRSEALLKKAQQLSSTGSFHWRVELDGIEYSEQTCRIYEFDPARPITLTLMATRTHPEDRLLLQEMIERARGAGSDLDCAYRLQMPNLAVKYLHLVAHGTRAKDGGLEYIGAIQDVTQRRLSEEALGKVRSELAHVARVSSLGVLTASIAHEVNQPLAGIVTNASTCLRMLAGAPPNVEGARETARRMIRDSHRASDVIAHLRALFARKSAANELVDLNEATCEVIALSASELRKSGAVLRSELEGDLPPVSGDRIQLQQVILNLLLNAVDAMRSVHDRPRRVEIRTERDADECVRLSVQDAGIGIEPVSVQRLFEAFYTTKSDGMGMGLSVSRSIIESHRGKLWAAAHEGPGATFAFSLPRASGDSTLRAHGSVVPSAGKSGTRQP